MTSTLSAPHFHDEEAAFAFLEARLWPNGPICPHCGGVERIGRMGGKSTRKGLHKCYQCRSQFTVKVGTVFEQSHVGLHIWLQAVALMAASKKGISANQLHRTLGVTLKTAWFMAHRIRLAMADGGFDLMGGAGKVVEADETYYGRSNVEPTKKPTHPRSKMQRHKDTRPKRPVISLVERGGKVRSFHVPFADKHTVMEIVQANIAKESRLHTDESNLYRTAGDHFAQHETIKHTAGEYARGDVTTNSVEGYFSVFKRGMRGTYQHCSEKHLHRYLAEFDFRFNNRVALGVDDAARASAALKGAVGKRLKYRSAC